MTEKAPGPLHEPGYRNWFFSQVLSSAGLQTQNVASAWIVFVQTHNGIALAMLAVVAQGPGLLLSAFAGSVLDRHSRRGVLMVTQTGLLLTSLTLGIVSLGGAPPLLAVFGLSLLAGVVNAFDGPARQVIVVDLVGIARVGQAVTYYEVSLSLARTLGPALGGALLGVAGPDACYFCNAASFLAPLVVLAFVKIRFAAERIAVHPAPTSAWHGIRYAFGSSAIRSCLAVAVLVGALVSTASYFPQFATTSLHLGSAGFGVLVACLGIGSLPGALLAARIGTRRRGRWVVVLAAVTGVVTLVTGLAPSAPFAFVGVVGIGVASIGLISLANTLTQLQVPDHLRGRVMGVWTMAIPGMNPITGLACGALANLLGPRAVFLALGTALGVVALISGRPLRAADAPPNTRPVTPNDTGDTMLRQR